MKVKFSLRGNLLVVYLTGEIDHHWAGYLRDKIDAEIVKSRCSNLVFDFSGVSFMDSSGIGVMLGRFKNIKNLNGKLAVVNLNRQMDRIFQMSGLSKIIPVYDSVELCISKL